MDDADDASTNSWTGGDSHFGLFGALDHRSAYYSDLFIEPLLVEETAPEPQGEIEADYLRTQALFDLRILSLIHI